MVNPIFGIGIWPMPILQLGYDLRQLYGNTGPKAWERNFHGEIIRAWDGTWPSVDMVDEAPSCDFLSKRTPFGHLLCFLFESAKTFPISASDTPHFCWWYIYIYTYIYICIYIQILGVRGFGWVWCPCWWCCCCCSLRMAYPVGLVEWVEWWFLGFWKLKWMISNKYNSYNGQNKVFQYWWDDT